MTAAVGCGSDEPARNTAGESEAAPIAEPEPAPEPDPPPVHDSQIRPSPEPSAPDLEPGFDLASETESETEPVLPVRRRRNAEPPARLQLVLRSTPPGAMAAIDG